MTLPESRVARGGADMARPLLWPHGLAVSI